jgi:hypothetical protein
VVRAGEALPKVCAPTLLIVGGRDEAVIEMNRVAALAAAWCRRHLGGTP